MKSGREFFRDDFYNGGSYSPKRKEENTFERYNNLSYDESEINQELASMKILDFIEENKLLAKNPSILLFNRLKELILFEGDLNKFPLPSNLYPNYETYSSKFCVLTKREFRYEFITLL